MIANGLEYAYPSGVDSYTGLPYNEPRAFDANVARSKGTEQCTQQDMSTVIYTIWDDSQPTGPGATQVSPNLLMAGGNYWGHDPYDCFGGHVLYGAAWTYWQNAVYPTVASELHPNNADGYVQCYTLWPSAPGSDPRNNGWCFSAPSGTF